jgi:hypothetical protein
VGARADRFQEDVPGMTPASLHPVWLAFIRYCGELKYGEIDKLKIQDGLPLLAEEVRRKIRFPDEG